MKVEETKPVEPAQTVRRQRSSVEAAQPREKRHHDDGPQDALADTASEPVDIAAFHGLDQDDLTEKARIAMMQLIEEIGQLRQELTRQRKRIAYLSNLADHDELSTGLNRRAFTRELAHAQILAREHGAENALLFVSIDNLKDINDRHGHAIGDAMVEHAAETMLHHLGKADVVGRLGGAEFGIVLVGAGEADAAEKADWLQKLLVHQPLIRDGQEIHQVVSIAVHPLDPAEEAEAALATSDRDAGP